MKDEIWEQLDTWFNNSTYISKKHKYINKVIGETKIKSEKDKMSKLKGDDPYNLFYSGFIRFPKTINKAIFGNSHLFTKNEMVLINYFFTQCFNWNRYICYYNRDNLSNETGISKCNIWRTMDKLVSKNIVKVLNVDNKTLKQKLASKYNIYTKTVVLVNVFFDTWDMNLRNLDELMEIDEDIVRKETDKILKS